MNNNQDIKIKLNIADRSYPLTIKAEEEEKVRRAARLINEKMAYFASNFSIKDNLDSLSMAALFFAIESLSDQYTSQAADKAVSDALSDIEKLFIS